MAIAAPPLGRPPRVDVTPEEREQLLALARLAVRAAAHGTAESARKAALEAIDDRPSREPRRGAAFVTLLRHGELRGCVGLLDPSRPLTESVTGAAIAAAVQDWRFEPVTAAELPELDVAISVLGPLVSLDDPTSFRLGVDGLLLERGTDRGLLLPEVATEHGLGTLAMLEAVSRKAGLPGDAWRLPGTHVSAFRTTRFGGPALG
ncbi:MAG TPA: AmmeMemoRadiSam system protein A [Candidatus Binatus sp.]|nr:AmmeMemoRadiSam system protein A [Candidatus Binatus sp.]